MGVRGLLGVLIATASACWAMPLALADEGLWPLNLLPVERLSSAHGFVPDGEWLQLVQRSCVRFRGGGSGALVSPRGLLMTNHHLGAEAIRHLGDERHDYLQDGFLAATPQKELRCSALYVDVLMEMHDITGRVEAAVVSGMTPDEAASARRAALAEIQAEAATRTGLQAEIVSLFGGARRHLYLYKRYDDVRLVMAPELAMAAFGGDRDNFEYPRHSLDVCFFRVYERDRPVRIQHHLQLATAGLDPGELVLVAGHPYRTQRSLTVAHLEFLRDGVLPLQLSAYNQREVSLLQFVARGESHRRLALGDLLEVQNARKALDARYATLLDDRLRRTTRQIEEELQGTIEGDPVLETKYGSPWEDITAAIKAMQATYPAYYLLEVQGDAFGELFGMARDLVRLAATRGNPDAQRLPEYRAAQNDAVTTRLRCPPPIQRDLERLRLRDALAVVARHLGGRHPATISALDGLSPDTRAALIIDGTHLDDLDVRGHLHRRGSQAIASSDDLMIRLARGIDVRALSARRLYEAAFLSALDDAYARIARMSWELHGETVCPEATGSLRLSLGTVAGYEENGRTIAPFTTFGGLHETARRRGDASPYRLPRRWADRRSQLDATTPLNFVCTADITGGSSGSPVLNRQGHVVGLIFDGNRQSLAWEYRYDQQQGRAVAVDVRAIVLALRKVYEADALVAELLAGRP